MSFFSDIGAGVSSLTTKLGENLTGVTQWIGDNAGELLSVVKQVEDLKQIGKPKPKNDNAPTPGPTVQTPPPQSGFSAPIVLGAVAIVALIALRGK